MGAAKKFPAAKADKVFAALLRIGWTVKRTASGSHKTLARPGWEDYTWAFHSSVEIGPRMLRRISKGTGLRPEDLSLLVYATRFPSVRSPLTPPASRG